MYILKVNSEFDSAHFLKGYDGKCSNIHGHRWKVEVEIKSEEVAKDGPYAGMVVDFGVLKDDLKEETAKLDHALVYQTGSLLDETKAAFLKEDFKTVEVDFRPTAENLAKYFHDVMTKRGYSVYKSTVYETPDNCAAYLSM